MDHSRSLRLPLEGSNHHSFFLRQELLQPSLALNSLCSQRWIWTHDHLDSISCTTIAGLCGAVDSTRGFLHAIQALYWLSCVSRLSSMHLYTTFFSLNCVFTINDYLWKLCETEEHWLGRQLSGEVIDSCVWDPGHHPQLWKTNQQMLQTSISHLLLSYCRP